MKQDYGLSILALVLILIISALGAFLTRLIKGIKTSKNNKCCAQKTFGGCCQTSQICKKLVIPPLIGEIIFGALARNLIPGEIMDHYNDQWSGTIRMVCLGIILLRGGMIIDLQGKGMGIILLSIIPPIVEGIIVSVLAFWWLNMPFQIALCLGSFIGAVSPAILVPCLINLQMRGYGVEKNIPISLLGSAIVNNIFNIILFSIFSSIAFTQAGVNKTSLGYALLKILLEILGGIAAGLLLGVLMKFLKNANHIIKSMLCLGVTLFFISISIVFTFPECKYVGIITFGYMCFKFWGVMGKPEKLLANIWTCLTPFLFGTIGASLKFSDIEANIILPSIFILLIGGFIRCCSTIATMSTHGNYTLKDKGFMAIAWLPKAAVQAALGGVILDFGKKQDIESFQKAGNQILTIAILSVIFYAPIGAIFTVTFGQKWLQKKELSQHLLKKNWSKWDIVYIYVTDFYQRKQEAKVLQSGSEKLVQFYLSAEDKQMRMQDRKKFLYQLKILKDYIQNQDEVYDEIEQHRNEMRQQLGSNLEFASAFSTLYSNNNQNNQFKYQQLLLEEKKKKQNSDQQCSEYQILQKGKQSIDTQLSQNNQNGNTDVEKQEMKHSSQNTKISSNSQNDSIQYRSESDIHSEIGEFNKEEFDKYVYNNAYLQQDIHKIKDNQFKNLSNQQKNVLQFYSDIMSIS